MNDSTRAVTTRAQRPSDNFPRLFPLALAAFLALPIFQGRGSDLDGEPKDTPRSTEPLPAPEPDRGASPAQGPGTAASPQEVAKLIASAWRTFYDESPEAALPLFRTATNRAPNRADAHFGVGRCLLSAGDPDQARAAFARAAVLDPDRLEYRFYVGISWYQEEAFDQALEVWESVLSGPNGPGDRRLLRDTAWLMGRANLALGRLSRACACFEQATTLYGLPGEGPQGHPEPELERTARGTLPGDRFEPLTGRPPLPSGQRIVFASAGCIWAIRGSLCLRERLTTPPPGWEDGFPAQRPGDGRLAFVTRDPGGTFWLMRLDGERQRTRLVPDPVLPVRPSWTWNGDRLAFCRLEGDPPRPSVAILTVETGQVTDLAWPEGPTTGPSFGPGNDLALVAWRDGAPLIALYTLGSDSGRYGHRLIPGQRRAPVDPVPTPRPPSPPLRLAEPWAAASQVEQTPDVAASTPTPDRNASTQKRPIPHLGPAIAAQPTLARTRSTRIAFCRTTGSLRRVYLWEGTERPARPLSPEDMNCFSPTFSPDGRSVVYTCRDHGVNRLYLQEVEGGRPIPLYEQALSATGADWIQLRDEPD